MKRRARETCVRVWRWQGVKNRSNELRWMASGKNYGKNILFRNVRRSYYLNIHMYNNIIYMCVRVFWCMRMYYYIMHTIRRLCARFRRSYVLSLQLWVREPTGGFDWRIPTCIELPHVFFRYPVEITQTYPLYRHSFNVCRQRPG